MSGSRIAAVDRARGLAVLLMLLDHALVLVQFRAHELVQWAYALRMTVTRASLPLFCLCTGVLLHFRRSSRRLLDVALVALVLNVALDVVPIGIGSPEILGVWSLVMLGSVWLLRWPVPVVVLGVLQATIWQVGWAGYEPGLVAAFVAVGVLAGRPALAWADALPAWVGAVGSRPLRWYVGHLVVLMGVQLAL